MSTVRLVAAVLATILAVGPARAAEFSPTPWLQDLDQLRDAMTTDYANLEWQARRGLDLPALYARARSRVEAAHDEFEARHAFERFLSAFGDGHLDVHWPTANAASAAQHSDTPQPLCDRLGYFDLHDGGGAALRLPGATGVGPPNAHLKAAVVEAAGRRIAVLRVGMFEPHAYPDICDEVGGVEPDLLIAFREHDAPTQRAARLGRVLPLALARATGHR